MSDTPQVNPKKLFVGSLPYSTTEQEIGDLFAQYGTIVSVRLVTDRVTGRSRGIAFVEYEEEAMATAAVEALNGHELNGRALVVNVARPQERRPYSGGSNNYRGGDNRGYRRDDNRY